MKRETLKRLALFAAAFLVPATITYFITEFIELRLSAAEALVATSSTTTAPISSQDYFRLPEPVRELPENIRDARQLQGRYGYHSYGDDYGNTYAQVFHAREPLWNCDLYYISGDTITSLPRARAKLAGCLDIYTDGHGTWYAVDPGYVGMRGDTRVYRLQRDKVVKIRGLEELRGLELYFDPKSKQWYGRWALAGATKDDVSTPVWHTINFPTLEGDVPLPVNTSVPTTTNQAPPTLPTRAPTQQPTQKPPVPAPPSTTTTEETVPEDTPPPSPFPATFISSVTWPPVIATSTKTDSLAALDCQDEASTLRTIAGSEYCVTFTTEGAAGSEYRSYTYETLTLTEHISASFVLRFPNCENFDEPERSTCKDEQATGDIDTLVHELIAAAQ